MKNRFKTVRIQECYENQEYFIAAGNELSFQRIREHCLTRLNTLSHSHRLLTHATEHARHVPLHAGCCALSIAP